MAVDLSVEYRDAVIAAAEKGEAPVDILLELLQLENVHTNLHGWGARPALRRDMERILDRAIEANR
jgi:hypothetical protein